MLLHQAGWCSSRPMATYLSVDLDYWGRHKFDGMRAFVSKAMKLAVPKCLVYSHEMMLDHINSFEFDRLINVDYHSDLCSPGKGLQLEDGTWAAFVKEENRKLFEWRMPSYHDCVVRELGLCDADKPRLLKEPEKTNWSAIRFRRGVRDIPWEDVLAVGFCPSFEYWTWKPEEVNPAYQEGHRLLRLFGLDVRDRSIDDFGYTVYRELIGAGKHVL